MVPSSLPQLPSGLTVDVHSWSCAVMENNIDGAYVNHPSVQAGIRLMESFVTLFLPLSF